MSMLVEFYYELSIVVLTLKELNNYKHSWPRTLPHILVVSYQYSSILQKHLIRWVTFRISPH